MEGGGQWVHAALCAGRAPGGEDGGGRVCGRCAFAAAGGARGPSPRGPATAGLLKRRCRGNSVTSRAGEQVGTLQTSPACTLRSRQVPALLCSQALAERPPPCHAGSRGRAGPTHSGHPTPTPLTLGVSLQLTRRQERLLCSTGLPGPLFSDRYLLHQGTQGHPSTDSGGSFGFRGSATSPAGLEGPWGREGKGGCGGLWTSFAQIRSGEEEKEAGAQGVL